MNTDLIRVYPGLEIRPIRGLHLQDIDFHAKLRKLSYSKLTDI